ncbi:MAG TPA: helix-turn-helix domain-containing protein [Microthrixaceae bacterium]|nr:helix-turn-helix domain-containing protein [Microthrixaceae bacterium]
MTRSYRSPTRDERRAATRTAICRAATELFVERGYAATQITAVAEAAGVSAQTVYDNFGTKRDLLRVIVHDAAVRDVDTMLDSTWVKDLEHETDQWRRWELMREAAASVLTAALPLTAVLKAAAVSEPEIASLWVEMEAQRRRDVEGLVQLLLAVGPLRLPEDDAVDLVWALSRTTDLYATLVTDRSWPAAKAVDAVSDTIARAILPDR